VQHPEPAATAIDRTSPRRAVVCSPHFDDAVLNCWSVLERDTDCTVVNVFTGAPRPGFVSWYDQLTGATCSTAQMQQRAAEDAEALSVAGKKSINLGLLEAQYRVRQSSWLHAVFRHARPIRFVVLRIPFRRPPLYTTPPPSVEQIAHAISDLAQPSSTLWVPAAIGGHADHVLVRQAGLLLAARGMDVRLYADLPYAIWHGGWPGWVGSEQDRRTPDHASRWWLRYLEGLRASIGDPIHEARVVRLGASEVARKSLAVRRYRTQFASLNGGRTRGRFDQEETIAYEVYWQARAAFGAVPTGRAGGEAPAKPRGVDLAGSPALRGQAVATHSLASTDRAQRS
jgi:hypothetical protein